MNLTLIPGRAAAARAHAERPRGCARLLAETFVADGERVRAARCGVLVMVVAAASVSADVVILNDAPPGLRAAVARGTLLHCRGRQAPVALLERTGRERMDVAVLRQGVLRDLPGLRAAVP